MRTRLLTLLLAFLAVPAALAATIAPPEYRECMKQAVDAHEGGLLDSLRAYNDGQEQALDERRARYVEAYDAETDQEIRDRLRDADDEYGDRLRDLKDDKRDRDRDVNRAYNDGKRACKDLRREIEKRQRDAVRNRNPFLDDCDANEVCFR